MRPFRTGASADRGRGDSYSHKHRHPQESTNREHQNQPNERGDQDEPDRRDRRLPFGHLRRDQRPNGGEETDYDGHAARQPVFRSVDQNRAAQRRPAHP